MKTIVTLIFAVVFAVSASAHCGSCGTEKAEGHKCSEACKDSCKAKEGHKCTDACKDKCAKKGEEKK
jgi:hypothetical protein